MPRATSLPQRRNNEFINSVLLRNLHIFFRNSMVQAVIHNVDKLWLLGNSSQKLLGFISSQHVYRCVFVISAQPSFFGLSSLVVSPIGEIDKL